MSTPAPSAAPPTPVPKPSLLGYVYTHNPFYAISAALLMYSVRSAYGELTIGSINCWLMAGMLAGYTLVLAVIGVGLVRAGGVWEDARSVLLLTVLLFLGISIGADDLLVNSGAAEHGSLIMLAGWLFSSLLSEVVLLFARIRFDWRVRVPYHLFLGLFFVTPYVLSPELHAWSAGEARWLILGFPVAAALLTLTLIPAVRRGPRLFTDNGTPWSWPYFPWTIFGLLLVGVAIRSFTLAMTFGPTGPIWAYAADGSRSIDFATMWGAYFLVPPALAILVLLLESALPRGDTAFARKLLLAAPLVLPLGLHVGLGIAFDQFVTQLTVGLASPLAITVALVAGFYAYALLRGVRDAELGLVSMICLLSIVDPTSTRFAPWRFPDGNVLAVAAGVALAVSVRPRSLIAFVAGAGLACAAAWQLAPELGLGDWRFAIVMHLGWVLLAGLGLLTTGRLARGLHVVSAVTLPIVVALTITRTPLADAAVATRATYVLAVLAAVLLIGPLRRSGWYRLSLLASAVATAYESLAFAARRVAVSVGWPAVTALLWSLSALLIGVLISAHKSGRLPERFLLRLRKADAEDSGTNGSSGPRPEPESP